MPHDVALEELRERRRQVYGHMKALHRQIDRDLDELDAIDAALAALNQLDQLDVAEARYRNAATRDADGR